MRKSLIYDFICRILIVYFVQEVILMKQGYSIYELMIKMKGNDITSFINNQNNRFTERFGCTFDETVKVTLVFETAYDAYAFYNDLKFNRTYNLDFKVRTDKEDSRKLHVDGAETLFDYFGSREPNLLTLSRNLNISFSIEFIQKYTGTKFIGNVQQGELLSRQCIIEISNILPELSLGGMIQIGRNQDEFDDLLTRCYIVEGKGINE